ncbi:MAG: tetratricopeptide repeat protein, partial [Sedimenticola sp.]|nr:tetratricopeptide repeat protein [Sedimenticola sp.]
SNQGSAYAVFAALDLAKVKYQQGDVNGAKAQLQWVLDNADDPSLKQIARLRQARILLDEGQVDAAAALIEQAPQDNYRGDVAELRGDIALKRGDKMAARQAYKEAIEYKVSNNALVQMKFDDLAVTE